jgi:hypothetical protein
MRLFNTYRAYIRNEWRTKRLQQAETKEDLGNAIRFWRFGQAAAKANEVAKLAMRRLQCQAARAHVATHMVKNGLTGIYRSLNSLLADYWRTQKRTRVVSRILRELAIPAAA